MIKVYVTTDLFALNNFLGFEVYTLLDIVPFEIKYQYIIITIKTIKYFDTYADLRKCYLDGDERIVMTAEGESIAKSLMGSKEGKNTQVCYCETSSDSLEGVDNCFTTAVSYITLLIVFHIYSNTL